MTSEHRGKAALQRYRAEQSDRKKLSVLQVLESFAGNDTVLSVASVGRAANVSREFIYSHRDLLAAVKKACAETNDSKSIGALPAGRDMASALTADKTTLIATTERLRLQVSELKVRIEELEHKRKLWLGSQLHQAEVVDPKTHAAIRMANERLTAENQSQAQIIAELRRLLAEVRHDLSASRQAHAEDMNMSSSQQGSVSRIDRPNLSN